MSQTDDIAARQAARAALGLAIGRRAEEVYERTIAQLYSKGQAVHPSAAYLDYRWGRSVVGTLLIARWLVSGIAADKDEIEWVTRSGGAAAREGIPLVETTRGHHLWREILIEVTREEAARLHTPGQTVAEVLQTIHANADASLVRIANSYDTQLRNTNAELARASKFKSEFLAKMSHQLRTPLTAIIGFCEVLSNGMDGELNKDQAEDVIQIHRSSLVLLELVNDILDLAKIEAGKVEIARDPVDLPAVVDQVISNLCQIAESKALTLTSSISAATPTVMGDTIRIREVLTNLVSNAIKFTPAGSVTISSVRRDSMAEISVIDTGIGIGKEAHERIFEEFRQASDSVARTYGGTGLGLSIARKLVELQGGRMGVESEPGKGSRFWFTLPMPLRVTAAA
ncbi:MAG TPA: ATP-binding protein [Candidatus Dormibacteraeota bacterium]|nr:ATP-binding protein [Candidatus Dormibacteraeota bacterium]